MRLVRLLKEEARQAWKDRYFWIGAVVGGLVIAAVAKEVT